MKRRLGFTYFDLLKRTKHNIVLMEPCKEVGASLFENIINVRINSSEKSAY